MTPPLISCIIPTRNRLSPLRWALSLLRRQTYPRTEVVVASTGEDPSPVIRQFPGVKHICLGQDATLGDQLNAAIRASSGPIIARVDDDDWYAPGRLEHQAAPVIAGKADLTAFRLAAWYDIASGMMRVDDSVRNRMVATGPAVFSRSAWDRVKFLRMKCREDTDFLSRLLGARGRFLQVPWRGMHVYIRHGGNTANFKAKELLGWKIIGPERIIPAGDLEELRSAFKRACPMILTDPGSRPPARL